MRCFRTDRLELDARCPEPWRFCEKKDNGNHTGITREDEEKQGYPAFSCSCGQPRRRQGQTGEAITKNDRRTMQETPEDGGEDRKLNSGGASLPQKSTRFTK